MLLNINYIDMFYNQSGDTFFTGKPQTLPGKDDTSVRKAQRISLCEELI